MIPPAFEYEAPASLDEALEILQQNGDEAKILAGGHSLLPLMKLRLAAPEMLVDLGRIPDLAYIRDQGDHVAIGAMTTYRQLETSDLLKDRLPLVPEVASVIGDMQVRNRGTMGGAVAHADPAGDMPTAVTALRGQIVVSGPSGERAISADDFFVDVFESVLRPDELVTEIRIPYASGQPRCAYQKFRVRASDWAIVGVAVNVARANGTIEDVSVVLTNVGTKPMRATSVEGALQGQEMSADAVRQAAEHASDGLNPSPELKASTEYKLHLSRVLTRRALEEALGLSAQG